MNPTLPRVLCVDDDNNILQAMRRTLGGEFDITTAVGGVAGIEMLSSGATFAVVVSDLRMPVVDGITLLHAAADHLPQTARILLTGNGDLEHAIQAVNEGHIFRFLTKPCPSSTLRTALQAGVRQHELMTAERVLLAETLRGAVHALSEMVSLVHPAVGAQTSRIRRTVVSLAEAVGARDVWEIEIVAMLSNLGTVTLPETSVVKLHLGRELMTHEQKLFARVPEVAAGLIAHIPRMDGVQRALLAQQARWDGSHSTDPAMHGDAIPLAARIVRLATDLDLLESRGMPRQRAISTLASRTGWYDPSVITALFGLEEAGSSSTDTDVVTVGALKPGMILAEDLLGHEGALMMARGAEVSAVLVGRIQEYWDEAMLKMSVRVQRPREPEERRDAA